MKNVFWHHATVTRQRRNTQNNHQSVVLWFTGLSGSGKSTLAHAIEEKLYQIGSAIGGGAILLLLVQ